MRLGLLCEICSGYAFRGKISNEDGGTVSVIQPRNILDNDFSNLVKISKENVKAKHYLDKNNILITNRGSFRSCVLDFSENTIASGGIFVISVKDSRVLPEYISVYLNSIDGQKQLLSLRETMTIPAITVDTLKKIEIPIIPLERQKKLSDVVRLHERKMTLLGELLDLENKRINKIIKGVING